MKKEKLCIVALWLIVGYAIALLIYCTFYFVFKKSDAYISAFGSVLSATATFAASFVAVYLFNDWRDEKNYELENTLLTNILVDLKPIYVELLKVRSDSLNLKRIETSFIVKTEYLERNRLDLVLSTLSLFPNIKTYSHIKNDHTLIDLYNKFDKHCFCFSHFFRILFLERYRRYYEVAVEESQKATGNPPLKYYDIFRSYSEARQDSLKIEIQEVLRVFKKDALTAEIDGVGQLTTYEDWLNETINLHNQIQDYCIKGLKVPT